MPDIEPTGHWSRTQRWLHGLTAILVLLGFGLGWWMVAVPLRALVFKFFLYQGHKTIGLIVAALTLSRLWLRWRRFRPPWPDDLSPWSRRAAALGHAMLYLLLLIVPLLGYLTAAAAPIRIPTLLFAAINVPHLIAPDPALFDVVRPAHRALAISLVILAAGHAVMAVWHHRLGRNTLTRIWRG